MNLLTAEQLAQLNIIKIIEQNYLTALQSYKQLFLDRFTEVLKNKKDYNQNIQVREENIIPRSNEDTELIHFTTEYGIYDLTIVYTLEGSEYFVKIHFSGVDHQIVPYTEFLPYESEDERNYLYFKTAEEALLENTINACVQWLTEGTITNS